MVDTAVPQSEGTGLRPGHAADSVTRRLVYSLALVPAVPAAALIGTVFCTSLPVPGLDELRWFHLFTSVLCVLCAVLVWRRLILWTMGRRWLTALIGMVPFVQVLYGQPLWNLPRTGCIDFSDDLLRVGQQHLGIAFWIWLSIWIWWGWEKLDMSATTTRIWRRTGRMSPTAKRIVASIGIIPFVFGSWFILQVALKDFAGMTDPSWQGFAIAAGIAMTLWILIWRGGVTWTRAAVVRTALLGCLCFGVPVGLQILFWAGSDGPAATILGSLPLIGWGIWMAATVTLWPMRLSPGHSEATGPHCLRCGYPLTGLTATRCPECGDQPTIDVLWAGNTGLL